MATENFKHLVLAHYGSMYRVAYSILRDSDDAQDAVQDAVAAMWAKRSMLSGIDNYESFCVKAVKNRCIDMLRTRASRMEMTDGEPGEEETGCLSAEIEARDTLSVVRSLVEKLPPLQQEVIRLRSEADCDLQEIAAITGVSHENARTLLSRARRRLKELYNNIK